LANWQRFVPTTANKTYTFKGNLQEALDQLFVLEKQTRTVRSSLFPLIEAGGRCIEQWQSIGKDCAVVQGRK
jgi:hypothetical protein